MNNKSNSLVSIIVPTYNVERYVSKCIESILCQSYHEIEVIIVNDGSTDKSLAQVEQFTTDQRVRIINKSNGGLSSARNAGLDAATGEFIYFIDSDDFIAPNAVELLVECIEKYNADFCCYRLAFCKEGTNEYTIHGADFQYEYLNTNDLILKDAFCGLNIKTSAWSKFWRRSFIEYNNLRFIEGLNNEDTLYTLSASLVANRVAFLNEQLYFALIRQTSISRNINSQNITNFFRVYDKIKELLFKQKKYTTYQKYFYISYTKSILYSLVLCASQATSKKQFIAIYNHLSYEPYVKNSKECNQIVAVSKKIFLLYKFSKYPGLFYAVVKMFNKLGVGLSSL